MFDRKAWNKEYREKNKERLRYNLARNEAYE